MTNYYLMSLSSIILYHFVISKAKLGVTKTQVPLHGLCLIVSQSSSLPVGTDQCKTHLITVELLIGAESQQPASSDSVFSNTDFLIASIVVL